MSVSITKTKRNEAVEVPEATAITTAGIEVDFDGQDDRTLLLVTSGANAAVTLTVLNGNGIQAVGDETFSVAAGKTVAIVLESMRFKNLKNGTVKLKASATGLTVQPIEL